MVKRVRKSKRRGSYFSAIRNFFSLVGDENEKKRGPEAPAVEEPVQLASDSRPVYSITKVLPFSPAALVRNRIVAFNEKDAVSEQFKLLRTLLLQYTRPKALSAIQVTGFCGGDGSTFVAANLAISIAKDVRQTTLLVDLNFRRPAIQKIMNLGEDALGLKSHFIDDAPIEEMLVNPGIDKLTVLPAGGVIPQAPEIIGSPKMESLVGELKDRYSDRYIIFDTPAVGEHPDAVVFSEYADAIIIVARPEHTTLDSIRGAMELIPRDKVLGVVMNDSVGP
ncbi:MAG: capsular biosynthesis protein [Syntrophobacteraceae bacterium]